MKFTKLLFLPFMALLACSKSESPALQNAKVTVTTVTPPAAMSSSQDTHAQSATSYLSEANGIAAFASALTVPASGAMKSAPITATNGRVSASASTTVTYVWSDPQYGSIGYQVTDDGTSYHWEYFYKAVGATSWLKYIDAVEKKDGTQGTLKIIDFSGSNPSLVESQYQWTKVAGVITFTITDNFSGDYFVLVYSTTTKAGSVNEYSGTGSSAVLYANYTWDTTGHGSWKEFGSNGTTVTASGTW